MPPIPSCFPAPSPGALLPFLRQVLRPPPPPPPEAAWALGTLFLPRLVKDLVLSKFPKVSVIRCHESLSAFLDTGKSCQSQELLGMLPSLSHWGIWVGIEGCPGTPIRTD